MNVEIVTTPDAMARGLGGRAKLGKNEGMLFDFKHEGLHRFWMKDMQFDLDLIWLNEAGTVVYIAQNLKPCTPDACPLYIPTQTATYVLEVNAGFTAAHGIAPGQPARLP